VSEWAPGDRVAAKHDCIGLYAPYSDDRRFEIGNVNTSYPARRGDTGTVVEWAQGYSKAGPTGHPNDMWRVRFEIHGLWAVGRNGIRPVTKLERQGYRTPRGARGA